MHLVLMLAVLLTLFLAANGATPASSCTDASENNSLENDTRDSNSTNCKKENASSVVPEVQKQPIDPLLMDQIPVSSGESIASDAEVHNTIYSYGEIYTCAMVSSPGSYMLTEDIMNVDSTHCINITSSDVEIFGMGHMIDGKDKELSYGVYVHNSGATLSNVSVMDLNVTNWFIGISYENVSGGRIANNLVSSNLAGIFLSSNSNNNTLDNNTVTSNTDSGFGLDATDDNILTNNTASLNGRGIWIYFSSGNTIYNNRFNNTYNTDIYYTSDSNKWNITRIPGKNIVGGLYLGGNFWANPNGTGFSETCDDNDRDGICDLKYTLSPENIDHIPLTKVSGGPIQVNSCMDISSPGEYVLTQNITNSNATYCINITSGGVVFDGMGYTIDGLDKEISIGVHVYNPTKTLSNVGIKNLKVSDWFIGILSRQVMNGSITNITASSNSQSGITFLSSDNNTITNNIIKSNNKGIDLQSSRNNIILNNTINLNSLYGIILFPSSSNNILSHNIIDSNFVNGLRLSNASNNIIYDNLFNNTDNAFDNGNNTWNTTKMKGLSIVGGPYLGGNYWANPVGMGFSQTCEDSNVDGICDSIYNVSSGNFDHLPLAEITGGIIDSCTVISSPGEYVLTQDITNSNATYCINITSSDVILDGAGHVIDGIHKSSYSYGVYVYKQGTILTNVSIRNLNVTDWYYGIEYYNITNGNIVDSVAVSNYDGIYLDRSSNNTLANNNASQNNRYGIYLQSSMDNTLTGNSLKSNSEGIDLYISNQNTIINNIAEGNYVGIRLYHSNYNKLTNNIVNLNKPSYAAMGFNLWYSNNNTLTDNIANYNYYGFSLQSSNGNIITSNNASSNIRNGFYFGDSRNNLIKDNIFKENNEYDFYFSVYQNAYCSNIVENNTGSGDRPIKYYNRTLNLKDEIVSELILCNADGSNMNNVTIAGSETKKNNGLFSYWTDNSTFVNLNSSNNYDGINFQRSNNNSISNSTFNSNYRGIYDYVSDRSRFVNITVMYNDYGFDLENSNYNTVDNNILNYNKYNGIWLDGSNNNIYTNNSASSNGYGINLRFSSYNTFQNNTVSSNRNYGIYHEHSYSNIYESNNVLNNSNDGIYLGYYDNNTIINNIFNSNRYNGIYINYGGGNNILNNTANLNSQYGIYIYQSNKNNITNNVADSNGYSGIYLQYSNNNSLKNNTVNSNHEDGFRFRWSSSNNISSITANSNQGYGILLSSNSDYNVMNNSRIENNTLHGVYLDYVPYVPGQFSDYNLIFNNYFNNTQNARDNGTNYWNITKTNGTNIIGRPYLGGNYWGHPNGTGFSQTCHDSNGDGICDSSYTIDPESVDYLPLAYSQGPPVLVVYQDHACTSGSSYFRNISEAVNAANNEDTVVVCPGSYRETFNIDKPLTLTSFAGRNDTEINWTDSSIKIRSDKVIIQGFTFSRKFKIKTSSTQIENLTAIIAENVSNIKIRDNKFSITVPSYVHIGIILSNTSDSIINNNSFEYQDSCIELSAGKLNGRSSNITIINNYIGRSSKGITVYPFSTNNTIKNNEINSWDQGVNVLGSIGENNGDIIEYNYINLSTFGIVYDISKGINNKVRNNTLVNNAIGIQAFANFSTGTRHLAITNNKILSPRENGIRLSGNGARGAFQVDSNIVEDSQGAGIVFYILKPGELISGLPGEEVYYNEITNNTINGEPYYHYVNENDLVIDGLTLKTENVSNTGKISIINSSDVRLSNLHLSNNSKGGSGLFLYNVQNSRIEGITSENNVYGIRDIDGYNNTFKSITTRNNMNGIDFKNNVLNMLYDLSSYSEYSAIDLENTLAVTVSDVNATDSYDSIRLNNSNGNTLRQIYLNNPYTGIFLDRSNDNVFNTGGIDLGKIGIKIRNSGGNEFNSLSINSSQYYVHSKGGYNSFSNMLLLSAQLQDYINTSFDGYCFALIPEYNPPPDSLEYIKNTGIYMKIEPTCSGTSLYGSIGGIPGEMSLASQNLQCTEFEEISGETPVSASSDSDQCPGECVDGYWYFDGVYLPPGDCEYRKYSPCPSGKCESKTKCACTDKCENGIFYYNGYWSASAGSCIYRQSNCPYGCNVNALKPGCSPNPCPDYCVEEGGSYFTYYGGVLLNSTTGECGNFNRTTCEYGCNNGRTGCAQLGELKGHINITLNYDNSNYASHAEESLALYNYNYFGNRWNLTKNSWPNNIADAARNIVNAEFNLNNEAMGHFAVMGNTLPTRVVYKEGKTPCISGSSYHTNVTLAVNAANNGDSVVICPGLYNDNVIINKYLDIMSFSGNPEDTIVQGVRAHFAVLHMSVDRVNLSGITIEKTAPYYSGFYSNLLQHSKIDNCIFKDNDGIYINILRNSTISNNKFINSTLTDLQIVYADDIEVDNNHISKQYDSDHDTPLVFHYLNRSNITNNTIVFSNSSGNNGLRVFEGNSNFIGYNDFSNIDTEISDYVINSDYGMDLYSLRNTSISGNDFRNFYISIRMNSSENNDISANTFQDSLHSLEIINSDYNEIRNNTVKGLHFLRRGIELDYSHHNNITGNTISNTDYSGISLLESKYNLIQNNSFWANNGFSIYLDYWADLNDIRDNYFQSNSYGIAIYDSSLVNITGNEILNNHNAGIALLQNAHNITIKENNIVGGWDCIWANNSHENTIEDNNMSKANASGVLLAWSDDNIIQRNGFFSNQGEAISLDLSSRNIISRNTAATSRTGIKLINWSGGNIVTNNTFSSNGKGIQLNDSYSNTFVGNNILNSTYNSNDWSFYNYYNQYDNGISGNYWKEFTDCKDMDDNGICDTGYTILPGPNMDNYPLAHPRTRDLIFDVIVIPADFGQATGFIQVTDDKGIPIAVSGIKMDAAVVSEQPKGSIFPAKFTTDKDGRASFNYQANDEYLTCVDCFDTAMIEAYIPYTIRPEREFRKIPILIKWPDIEQVKPKYRKYFLNDYNIDNELNVSVSWDKQLSPRKVSVTPPDLSPIIYDGFEPDWDYRPETATSETIHPFDMKDLPVGPSMFLIEAVSEQTTSARTETLFHKLAPEKRVPRFPTTKYGSGYVAGQNYVNLSKVTDISIYDDYVNFTYDETYFHYNFDREFLSFDVDKYNVDGNLDIKAAIGKFHYDGNGNDIYVSYNGTIVNFSYHDGVSVETRFNTENYETYFKYNDIGDSIFIDATYRNKVLEFTYNGFNITYRKGEIEYVGEERIPIGTENKVKEIIENIKPVIKITNTIINVVKLVKSGIAIANVIIEVYDRVKELPDFNVPDWVPWVGGHYGPTSGSPIVYLGEYGSFNSITGGGKNSYNGGVNFGLGKTNISIDADRTALFRPEGNNLSLHEVDWNMAAGVYNIPLTELDFAVIKAGITMDIKVSFFFVQRIENGELRFYSAEGDIDVMGKLKAGADIGIAGVTVTGGAGVGVGAGLDRNYNFHMTSLRASLLISVDWYFLFYSDHWGRKFICDLWKGDCWTEEASRPGRWVLIDRDYLGPEYNMLVAMLMHSSATEEYLIIKNTYPDADPELALDSQGSKMIVYVADDPNKTITQAFDIYYTFDDGSGWSSPVAIVNDTTPDFKPDVTFTSDGRAIAVWTKLNNDSLPGEPGNFSDIIKYAEIAYAVYENGMWQQPELLTDDHFFDYKPRIAGDEYGRAMVMWMKNPRNEIYIGNNATQNHSLASDYYYSVWDGTTFSAPAPALSSIYIPENLEFNYAQGSATAVWSEDMDANSSTTDDREVYYSIFESNNWSSKVRFTNDNREDRLPGVLYFDDRTILVWVKDNSTANVTENLLLYSVYNGSAWSGPGMILSSPKVEGLKVVRNPQNNPVILWQSYNGNELNIFYSVFDKQHNSWSMINTLTNDSDLEQSFSPLIDPENQILNTYIRKGIVLQNVTMDNGNETYNLTTTKIVNASIYLLKHKIFTDLEISNNDISFSNPNPKPGETITITASIHNAGDLGLSSVLVRFSDGENGNDIGIDGIDVIRGSETRQVSTNWMVPADGQQHVVYVTIDPLDDIVEENETNNVAYRAVLLPDLVQRAMYIEQIDYDKISIDTTVMNNGNYNASASSVNFYYSTSPFVEDAKTLIGSSAVDELSVGERESKSTTWNLTGIAEGYYYIHSIIDEPDLIIEGDESNNMESFPVRISPDIAINGKDIVVSNNIFNSVSLDIKVNNQGSVEAQNIPVALFTANPYQVINGTSVLNESAIIASNIITSLGPNQSTTVTFSTTLPIDTYYFFVVVDYDNTIEETDETNNVAVSPHLNYIVSGMTKTGETTIDTNGDGLFDYLNIALGTNVSHAGNYSIVGSLYRDDSRITTTINSLHLSEGYQDVNITFNGIDIRNSAQNGPYRVIGARLYDSEGSLVGRASNETTNYYDYTDFQGRSVSFESVVSEQGVDTDGDGLFNYLVIDMKVDVSRAGSYTLFGSLYDDNRSFISYQYKSVSLIAGIQTVGMEFNGYDIRSSGIDGYYTLAYFRIYNNDSFIVEEKTDIYRTSYYRAEQFDYSHEETKNPIPICGPDKLKCENIASPVSFNASASYDPDGVIVSYYWEFGDGTNGTSVAPTHKYSTYRWNGSAYLPFIVNLTVMDNSGLINTTSQKVVIWIAGEANGDGKVNILDASLVGLRWAGNDQCADINNDGKVNIIDASIIGLNWGKTA